MKKFTTLLTLATAVTLCCPLYSVSALPLPSCVTSLTTTTTATSTDVEIQPPKKKLNIGNVVNWGLAKIETVFNGNIDISELVTKFINKCDHIYTIMMRSFVELTMTYTQLQTKEITRLHEFDIEFKDLVKLRNKIDRRCLHPKDEIDRSVCVDRGVEIQDKIRNLRDRRSRSANAIERYNSMIDWCASYDNWFC
jgi:hypothetical protein